MQSESRIGYPGAVGMSSMAAQPVQRYHRQQQCLVSAESTCQRQHQQSLAPQVSRTFRQAFDSGQQQQPAARQQQRRQQQIVAATTFQPHEQSNPSAQPPPQQPFAAYHGQQAPQAPYTSSDSNYLQLEATSQNLTQPRQHLSVHYQEQPPSGNRRLGSAGGSFENSPDHHHKLEPLASYAARRQHAHNQQLAECSPEYLPQSQMVAGNCSPMASSSEIVMSMQQGNQQQQQLFACEATDRFDQAIAQTQAVFDSNRHAASACAGSGRLAQLRPRVNSISATRRELPLAADYSSRLQTGVLTRSLSFSANDLNGQVPAIMGRPLIAPGGELCCLSDEPQTVAGNSCEQLIGRCYERDFNGPGALLAPGSMSSACSSIGSPVPMVLSSGGNCGDAIPSPIGHQPRPISSNSSSDGGAIYSQLQQQQIPHASSGDYQLQQQVQQQNHNGGGGGGGSTATTTSSCGSSIISTSDSMSMSINLEQYISKRNERERSRVRNVNDAFDNLKNSLPLDVEKMSKRMSKVEILRTAIGYIRNLEQVLGYRHQFGACDDPKGHRFGQRISCSSSAAAKRLNFSRSFRRLDSLHQQRLQRHREHCRGSSDDRIHDHYETDGSDRFDSSPSKMIKRDAEDEDYLSSKTLTADLGRRADEQLVGRNQQRTGEGNSRLEDQFVEY